MTPSQRDLWNDLGYYGPPVEPLWLPWWMWQICHKRLRAWARA